MLSRKDNSLTLNASLLHLTTCAVCHLPLAGSEKHHPPLLTACKIGKFVKICQEYNYKLK